MDIGENCKRYHSMLAYARARGLVPKRIPLKYGKPASKKTLMELFTSGKLSPTQMADVALKLFPKKEKKTKQMKKKSAVSKKVAVVQRVVTVDKLKAEKMKKLIESYKFEDRCADIGSAGNGL